MKNKKKIIISSSVVAGIAVILIVFHFVLQTADKIIFDLATQNNTPEQKEEQKVWQEDMSLLGRIFWNSIIIQLDKEEATPSLFRSTKKEVTLDCDYLSNQGSLLFTLDI